ncbi:FecR family protein [Celeribacter sp. ULVN23_4]
MVTDAEELSKLDAQTSRLLSEAIDLMIRRQDAPDNPVTLQTIANWRARSDAHDRIWQRVAEAHGLSGVALGQSDKSRIMSRRNVILGGVTALGAGALSSWAVPEMRLRMGADHLTTTAELLPIDMPDGSAMILGPDSAIAVSSTRDMREIRLLRGMGWFEITKDVDRPFYLDMGDGNFARMAGATFEISRDAGMLNLAVAQNSVELTGGSGHVVEAGHWVRVDQRSSLFEEGERDPSFAGAWKNGVIVAEAEPMEALVARISRWIPGRVIVAAPSIAQARISGVFDVSDPFRALEAAVRPTDAQVRRVPGLLTVISSA